MNETKMNINRVFWIDLIRVVSALFVVTIHVSTRVSGGFEPHGTSSAWLIAHTLNSSLNQFAVPLFIMISGALLLARSEEPLTFYRRRFGKILLPFIAWPALYLLCRVFMGQTLENGVPITLASALGAIFTESTQICGHFWFFYILLSVYIAVPFLSVFVRNASKNTLYCFLGLWFFGVAVYPVLDKLAAELFGMTGFSPYLHFSLFSLWVGFFIAGYVLKDCVITKGQAMFAGVLFCLLFFLEPVNGYLRNTNPESF